VSDGWFVGLMSIATCVLAGRGELGLDDLRNIDLATVGPSTRRRYAPRPGRLRHVADLARAVSA
jgi:hypothetical protein